MSLDENPIVERLECGCVRNIFEETIRTDFCPKHAQNPESKE